MRILYRAPGQRRSVSVICHVQAQSSPPFIVHPDSRLFWRFEQGRPFIFHFRTPRIQCWCHFFFFSQQNILFLSGFFLLPSHLSPLRIFSLSLSEHYSSEITSHWNTNSGEVAKKTRCVFVPVDATKSKEKRKSYNGKNHISYDNRSVRVCMTRRRKKRREKNGWEEGNKKAKRNALSLSLCVCYFKHILHQNDSIDFLIRRFSYFTFFHAIRSFVHFGPIFFFARGTA